MLFLYIVNTIASNIDKAYNMSFANKRCNTSYFRYKQPNRKYGKLLIVIKLYGNGRNGPEYHNTIINKQYNTPNSRLVLVPNLLDTAKNA